jgi:hypothetical protein
MGVDIIQLPPDSTGKGLYAITETVSGNTVYFEVHGLVDSSGNVASTVNPFPVRMVSGSVTNDSGVEIIWRGVRVSGTVAVSGVVQISGETIITAKNGATSVLFSGYGTTNTVVYSGFGFTQHEAATFVLTHLGNGSGINYSIRGYVLSGVAPYVLSSGTINSGDVSVETITDPYSWIDIGADSTQDNFSGLLTVAVLRR